jgi:hypothetical protein
VLQSHTASQQWQSFEMRMRRRRVERCLLRASVAIEAGVLDDAREAIEEVRRLDPEEPGLEPLTAQLASAENPPIIEPVVLAATEPESASAGRPESTPAGSRRFAAAAVVLMAGALAAGWWWASNPGTFATQQVVATSTPPAGQRVTEPPPDPSVRVSETSIAAPISAEPLRTGDTPTPTTGLAALESGAVQPDVRAAANIERPAPVITNADSRTTPADPVQDSPAIARSERPPLAENRSSAVVPAPADPAPPIVPPPPPPPPTSAKLEPLTGLPETAPASPRVVAGAEGITAPEAAARSAEALTTLPSAPPADAATSRSEEQSVRAVLGRYESAYNRLDAVAAASVWPSVNQRALASAFQGLSAQSISLGGCDIRVSGATAHAECSGNARWTQKVGGGTQNARRQWRFDLRNSSGSWVITQATTR